MSAKVSDWLALLYVLPGYDCSFMRSDGVSVGSRDFERTFCAPHVDIFAHVSPEILLLSIGLQIVMELAESGKLE